MFKVKMKATTPFVVDLRSDTVTKPTEAMKHAMVNSALGDDVFGEDPTVNALETKLAALMGKQAALFVPTGTMANLIAIMVHCNKRGSEAIVGNKAHIFKYELGGAAHLAGVLLTTIENKPDGTFDLVELESRIRGTDIHEPITSLVTIENTHNVCGGKVLPLKFIDELSSMCRKHSLALHVDGARVFNAAARSGAPPARLVRDCDSAALCFSKGLSAPVGSALVGTCHFIQQARRVRKMLGGGMRQVGVLAAAAIVALDEVVPLLHLDHSRTLVLAKEIKAVSQKTFTVDLENIHTNILLVKIAEQSSITAGKFLQRLEQITPEENKDDEDGVIVKAISFNNKTVRFTLHREITDQLLWLAINKIQLVIKEFENEH